LTREAQDKKERIREAKKRERLASVVVVLLILTASGMVGIYALLPSLTSPAPPMKAKPIDIGQRAPDFTLPLIDANGLTRNSFSLENTRGKVVLIEFMVSWCSHCRAMAPQIKDLAMQFQGTDVMFVSVAATWQGATAESTAEFIGKYGSNWPHVLDADNSVFAKYGVTGTPTYFVLDRGGKVVAKHEGEVRIGTLVADMRRALG